MFPSLWICHLWKTVRGWSWNAKAALLLNVQTHQGALDNLENVYIKRGGAGACIKKKTPSNGGQVYLHQVVTWGLVSSWCLQQPRQSALLYHWCHALLWWFDIAAAHANWQTWLASPNGQAQEPCLAALCQ